MTKAFRRSFPAQREAEATVKDSFRQSMASLHSWAGLIPGWLLFAIFLFGSAAFFQQEISRWMRPELRHYALTEPALKAAGSYLAIHAKGAQSWRVTLPSPRGGEPLSLSWTARNGESAASAKAVLDPSTGQPLAVRDTLGGWFLYRFHFDLHYMPWWVARYLVSIAALAMLVAILSGIITHKKIFADFFMLRFGKGQRSWLDAHNVTAVLALPFHLMITYTGLVTLLFTLMPWAILANFPNTQAFADAIYPRAPEVKVSGRPADVLPLDTLYRRAMAAAHGQRPESIAITSPGDMTAVAEIWPQREAMGGGRGPVVLNATNGAVLKAPPAPGGADKTQGIMVDLHTGLFAGPVLRWLYFLSGLCGTVMVASGLILWTVKRRARLPDPSHPYFGFRLVERLNIGVLAGAPAGIAVYFLANRLLPSSLAERASWEIHSLFIAWGAIMAWAMMRPARRAWVETLSACAGLYALVPLVDGATTTRGLIPSLIAGDWPFAGFDCVMIAAASGFAVAAHKVAKVRPHAAARRRQKQPMEAVA